MGADGRFGKSDHAWSKLAVRSCLSGCSYLSLTNSRQITFSFVYHRFVQKFTVRKVFRLKIYNFKKYFEVVRWKVRYGMRSFKRKNKAGERWLGAVCMIVSRMRFMGDQGLIVSVPPSSLSPSLFRCLRPLSSVPSSFYFCQQFPVQAYSLQLQQFWRFLYFCANSILNLWGFD